MGCQELEAAKQKAMKDPAPKLKSNKTGHQK